MAKPSRKAISRYSLALGSGLLMGLSFQVEALFFVAWLALVPLFCLLYAGESFKQTLALLALYAAGFQMLLNSYLFALHPLDYLGFEPTVSALLLTVGWLLVCAIEVGWHLLLGLAYHTLRRRMRGKLATYPLLPLVALWVVMEWAQGLGTLGYTWGRLAVSQAAVPAFIQSAALGGSLLVSGLILLVNALLAQALLSHNKRWLLAALAVFVLNLGGGALRLQLNQDYSSQPTLTAAVVQGTLPSHIKWEQERDEQSRRQYQEHTLAAAAEGAELIVWPETALAERLREGYPEDAAFYQALAQATGQELLIGAIWRTAEESNYNALLRITDAQVEMVYGKRQLVPFGEYVPLQGLIERFIPGLTSHLNNLSRYAERGYFGAAGSGLGGLLCYDSIFAQLAQSSMGEGAEIIILGTNDSWFWGTQAMRQHYQQAQLRAVEQNRWLLRAANAGYSGVIDNCGRSVARINPEDEGHITYVTPRLTAHSLYYYLHDWPVYLSLAYLLFLLVGGRKNKPI